MASNITTAVPVMASPFTLDIQIGLSIYAILLFCFSLVGNVVVIHIVRTRDHMRNPTNTLIANMALADLLLTFDIPYVVKWFYVGDAWFGNDFFSEFLCKFFHSAQIGSITCSVLTLVVISFDRCIAITYPLKRVFTDRILKASIAGIWLAAIGLTIPMFIVTQTKQFDGTNICTENWMDFPAMKERRFIVVFSTCTYFVPLILIAVAYFITGIHLWSRKLPGNENLLAQQKINASSKKATIMLITVVMVFALCWLPLQIREILRVYNEHLQIPVKLEISLPWIGFTNIAINPCLYFIFSENYRREFLNILCCHDSHKLDIYQGLASIPQSPRSTPMGTPMLSRAMTEQHRQSLKPYIYKHRFPPPDKAIKLQNIHSEDDDE